MKQLGLSSYYENFTLQPEMVNRRKYRMTEQNYIEKTMKKLFCKT